jgi:hypothetical protein
VGISDDTPSGDAEDLDQVATVEGVVELDVAVIARSAPLDPCIHSFVLARH